MPEFDAATIAKLKAMGLYTDEQENQLKEDRKQKEQAHAKQKAARNRSMESHMGKNSRGGGRNGGRAPQHREIVLHGQYGAIKGAPVDVKPPAIATAPYNFVPLPDRILPSQLDGSIHDILIGGDGQPKTTLSKDERKNLQQAFHAYRTKGEHFEGVIRLNIENLTPLFLGGNGEDTFAPTGEPIIPGSELRGMTKNLFKIITCGGWRAGEDMTDHHLYYRSLMATGNTPFNSGLHEVYTNHMMGTDEKGKQVKLAKPGFLVQRGRRYFIYPLLPKKLHAIVIRDYMDQFHAGDRDIRRSSVRWDGRTAYVQVGLLSTKWLKPKDEIEDFFRTTPPNQRHNIGKQYYKYMSVDDLDKSKCYEIPPEVVEEYNSDKNRHGMDLIKRNRVIGNAPSSVAGLEPFNAIVPCFFLLEDGQIKSFGHGQSYRIPYDHSTMDAVPDALKKPTIDFADAVFGHAGTIASWASRVSFDDARMTKSTGTCQPCLAHPLMQPNPTAFQLYLKQDDPEKLKHWDSDKPEIRGYKLYWHQPNGNQWQASQKELGNLGKREKGSVDLQKTITPLKAGSQFTGQIRFHDLSREELGALLKVFSIGDGQQDIAYKIGMGKSIGLGSIRIQAQLCLEDGSRYQTLFDDNGWHDSLREADAASFIDAYETYLHDAVDGALDNSYSFTIRTLQDMLDYQRTKEPGWQEGTAAINGDTEDKNNKDHRFRDRNVLPDAADVLKKIKNGL